MKQNMKKCIVCNKNLARKLNGIGNEVKKCRKCWLESQHGRKIGIFCKKCNKELSYKLSKTFLCRECWKKSNPIPMNKGKTQKAWNKGLSKYKNLKEAQQEWQKRRKEKYYSLTTIDKLPDLLRTRIRNGLKYCGKSESTKELLGCSYAFFKKYIESLFSSGMSWNNYGNSRNNWNIDHIIPISKFNLTLKEERIRAFNYKNCQPIWAIDNFRKKDKIY